VCAGVTALAGCALLGPSGGPSLEIAADRDVDVALAAWLLANGGAEGGSLRAAVAADLAPLAREPLVEEARRAAADGRSLNAWLNACLDGSDAVSRFRDDDRVRASLDATDGERARALEHVRDGLPLAATAAAARRRLGLPTDRRLALVVSLYAPDALGIALDRPDRRIAIVSPRLEAGGSARRDVRPRFELAGVVLHELAHPEARSAVRADAALLARLEPRVAPLAAGSGQPASSWLEENVASAIACAAEADALGVREADAFEREEERRGLVLVPWMRERLGDGALGSAPWLADLESLDVSPLVRRAALACDLRRARRGGAAALAPLVDRYPDDPEPRFALAESLFEAGRSAEAAAAFRAFLDSPSADRAPDLASLASDRVRRIAAASDVGTRRGR
jgi:hypothetical protein